MYFFLVFEPMTFVLLPNALPTELQRLKKLNIRTSNQSKTVEKPNQCVEAEALQKHMQFYTIYRSGLKQLEKSNFTQFVYYVCLSLQLIDIADFLYTLKTKCCP